MFILKLIGKWDCNSKLKLLIILFSEIKMILYIYLFISLMPWRICSFLEYNAMLIMIKEQSLSFSDPTYHQFSSGSESCRVCDVDFFAFSSGAIVQIRSLRRAYRKIFMASDTNENFEDRLVKVVLHVKRL